MAQNEFFQSVRNATKFLAPRVTTDNPYTDPKRLERDLSAAVIWLTEKAVEGYNSHDFETLPARTREALDRNVKEFQDIARTVPGNRPAPAGKVREALPRFLNIFTTVQTLIRDEWWEAAGQLVAQAQGWAHQRDWPTRLFPKQISEDFLGTYELNKFVFAFQGTQLVLDPVGRFAPGTDGLFDLAVLPVYDSVMVVRRGGRWRIHPLADEDRRREREWSEAAFVETVERLARLA